MAEVERVITDPNTMDWTDGTIETHLPAGVRTKLLSRDPVMGVRNLLVSFPPGYVEPRHVHGVSHATFLLQGRWIIEGKEIGPGGYMFGPGDLPHGPFESPEGSLVFSSGLGGSSVHQYPTTPEQEARAVKTVIVDPSEVEWQDAAENLNLPEGVRIKVYNEDAATGRRDMLVHFQPGYVEPRHTHGMTHYDTLLEGRWIIEGTEVTMGGHIFGPPDVPHGPFECPDGVTVCASTFGDPAHHVA